MRNKCFLAVIAIALFALWPPDAHARQKSFMDWIFTPPMPDFKRPYLQDAKTPHPAQRERDVWTPDIWDPEGKSEQEVMRGFYDAKIVTGQYMDNDAVLFNRGGGVPVLEVGNAFLRLSDEDKRRVVMYVDKVWGATAKSEMMLINLERGGAPVGVYTKGGLQLQ